MEVEGAFIGRDKLVVGRFEYCFVYPSSETGESCSHLPLYATVRIAPGMSTLAVRFPPRVAGGVTPADRLSNRVSLCRPRHPTTAWFTPPVVTPADPL
ncbi:unnamed protein product [Schistocephalus solidus]|uniref:Transposase n=1 Tax=Schistocephalus solidus TaxID=70667 RepID=A0A183SIH2_SCHSO|nr:unnamed protein product [Schistocephalus solidus]